MNESKYVFYRANAPSRTALLPEGYRFEFWRPSLLKPLPQGMKVNHGRFLFRSFLHAAHLFSNRECGILIVRRHDAIVHYSAFAGAWFRWPFMATDDVQIGDTWTAEHERRKGFAVFALVSIMETLREPKRSFWYFSAEDNVASRRVAQRAGMEVAGVGACFPMMKLNLLRQYRITETMHEATPSSWHGDGTAVRLPHVERDIRG